MNVSRFHLGLTLIALTFSSPFAHALMLNPSSLNQRVGWSQSICEMTITDKRVELDPEADGNKAVYYTATVHECLKGKVSSPYVFKQTIIEGMPQYNVETRYLLFIPEETDEGYVGPVGFDEGVYELKLTGGKWVAPALKKEDYGTEANSLSLDINPSEHQDDYSTFKATITKLAGEEKP
jgi:hypothetical protein